MLNAPNALDLPANFSSLGPSGYSNPEGVVEDLEAQVRLAEASSSAVYQRCLGRTGEQLAFVGTQSVVRDLDALAKAIDGEEAKLNYWGMSVSTLPACVMPDGREFFGASELTLTSLCSTVPSWDST